MKDYEKSYIACFIDTDGTLTMRTRKMQNGRYWFEIRIICFNCEEQKIMEHLKSITNMGCVTVATRKKYHNNKFPEYKFVISSFKDVEKILNDVYPFMHLERKKKIARLLLEVCFIHKNVRKNQHPKFIFGERFQYPQRIFEIQKEITELNVK